MIRTALRFTCVCHQTKIRVGLPLYRSSRSVTVTGSAVDNPKTDVELSDADPLVKRIYKGIQVKYVHVLFIVPNLIIV